MFNFIGYFIVLVILTLCGVFSFGEAVFLLLVGIVLAFLFWPLVDVYKRQGWWLALNAGVVVVILTLLMLPASIISQVKPVEAIRYDS